MSVQSVAGKEHGGTSGLSTNRKDDILHFAAELFARQGYHATTVADIARAAGIAQGTVYLYFGSKKEVFSALVDQTLTLFHDVLIESRRLRHVQTISQLAQQMPAIYRRALRLLHDNRTLTRLMLTEVRGADAEIEAKLAAFYADVSAHIETGIRSGIERGFYRPDVNPPLMAQCLLGMMERLAAHFLFEADAGLDLDAIARDLARFELRGLVHSDHTEAVWQLEQSPPEPDAEAL